MECGHLARFVRLYEKKRGDRRTGSQLFGSLGEALFFGIFFAVGCLALAWMWVVLVWPEWRANRQFSPVAATVIDKRVRIRDATTSDPTMYRPELRVKYEFAGQPYDVDEVYDVTQLYSPHEQQVRADLDEFKVGHEYTAWCDPLDPHRVVLVRGYSGWIYLWLLLPVSFIIIGGGRLIYALLHWNASDERRAVLSQRATQLDLFEVDSATHRFPNVPADTNQTNSPGTTLAFRLPVATTAGWTLFASGISCVLWNGIAGLFAVMAISGITRGEPDWRLIAFVVPLVLVGAALIAFFVRQILATTGVGPTRVEISAHPLAPGKSYELFLSQAGRLAISTLELWLACDEKATFRQGTDTRTESRRVYEQRCFVRENFEIHQGLPFESRCEVSVPEGAMHSFHANYNEVSWKLIVKGNVVGWPAYEREFQIVVNPDANGQLKP